MKCCIACEHFCYDPGNPGYSDWTPGWDASMSCEKQHFGAHDYGLDLVHTVLNKAPSCVDYTLSQAAVDAGWTTA